MIRRAISVRQPWAWAIVNGYKPVENRTTNFVGAYRGPLLIHAGREPAEPVSFTAIRQIFRETGHDPEDLPELRDLPLGGFIGEAVIVDVVSRHSSPWFTGPVGIVLAAPRPFNLVRWPGQLGLFSVDDERCPIPEPPAATQGRLPL